MAKPIVAIVGRPNVGKSTLFNKVVGRRISIVEDTPGITRDRIYQDAEWCGRHFSLVDTGGIEPKANDVILAQMKSQADIAIETADVIVFMVNLRDGVTAADHDVAAMLMKSKKPVLLVVNKVDSPGKPPMEFYEFFNLGIADPMAISSTHGMGVGDLLDEIVKFLPEEEEQGEEDDTIKVSVIGKPNVGKSSFINRVLGEKRVIVSNIAGTTRDAIDTPFEKNGQKYVLIDTAGMRKRGKIDDTIERYSVVRALAAVDRSDVCIMMIDASEGITEQDTKIAGYAHDNGKASVIVVNKWDLIEKDDKTAEKFTKAVYHKLIFMTYAPIIFTSVETGQRVDQVFDLIQKVNLQHKMRFPTGVLNDILAEAITKTQPPSDKGKRLKLYYITQVSVAPPTFVLFVNSEELAHFSYIRYIENQLRAALSLDSTPIRIIIRERTREK